jgi:putative Mn2+ efflux pump MntP
MRSEDKTSKWTGGIILVVVGVVGLLANFDLIDRDSLRHLWKLWPLFPLAIGLRILFRDKPPGGPEAQ